MDRTHDEWLETCDTIRAGYCPSGDKRQTYLSSDVLVDGLLKWFPKPKKSSVIVDLGCGNGRLAMGLIRRKIDVAYTGIDVILPCVEWCKEIFAPWPWFKFIHLDVKNERYWAGGKVLPENVKLPFEDSSVNVVFANSFFSHLGEVKNVARYMGEIARILKPGGLLISTWFVGENEIYKDKQSVYNPKTMTALFHDFKCIQWIDEPLHPEFQTEIVASI